MAVGTKIQYAKLDELCLDPMNPRLGRGNTGGNISQLKILELMRDWTLDELAVSFLESGFWPQEALLVVQEPLYGKTRLVVVEGNRRLAALRYLYDAINGKPAYRKWVEIAATKEPPPGLFTDIPYIQVDSRRDVEAFLGFRHVTGIKEWKPAEKAQYVARLIEERGLTYEEVMRKIGSKTPTVRQNYISYRILLQMEGREDIALEQVEDKFSVLYLSLRTRGVQQYLQIDIAAEPSAARYPVPKERLDNLAKFALWLFGDNSRPPLVSDSRLVDDFGTILESHDAVEYLESSEVPNFDQAYRLAGGDEQETIKHVQSAANSIELALSRVHFHTTSAKLQKEVKRLGIDALQLLKLFPSIHERLIKEK